MGVWDSEFDELVDDEDNNTTTLSDDENQAVRRKPSPIPSFPPPSAEEFKDLPISEQLAYVKPVLTAILNGEYAPAKEQHDNYIKGGSAREEATKSAGLRGTMPPVQVAELQRSLGRWVLRGERRAQKYVEKLDDGQPSYAGSNDEAVGFVLMTLLNFSLKSSLGYVCVGQSLCSLSDPKRTNQR